MLNNIDLHNEDYYFIYCMPLDLTLDESYEIDGTNERATLHSKRKWGKI